MHDRIPVYTNEATGFDVYLIDGEDLLTDLQEQQLVQDMIPITEYGNCAFETKHVSGMSSYDYTDKNYADYFEESGTLFLIDMGNRQIHLYNSKKIERTVTPSYSNSITDNVYMYASNGDYYRCASEAFRQEATLLQGGRIAQPMKYISCALLALIIALFVNYIIVRRSSKNVRTTRDKIMEAVIATALIGSAATTVTRRERRESYDSSGGSSGGGGGGGFSGGGHSF